MKYLIKEYVMTPTVMALLTVLALALIAFNLA